MSCHHILLVEDDDNDVFFFQRAVQQLGIQNPVHVVRDGLEAMDYLDGAAPFDNHSEFPFPSLIFLDLNLPRKHGLEVLKWIRQNTEWAALPVIVLTSSSSELDVTVAYRLGADSFFVKPNDPDQLVELVKFVTQSCFQPDQAPSTPPESFRQRPNKNSID